ERCYYEAYERSCNDETTFAHKITGGKNGKLTRVGTVRKGSCGNPTFLAGVQWCIEQRCKMLGLLEIPPPVVPVSVQVANVWSRMESYDMEIKQAIEAEAKEAQQSQLTDSDLAAAGFAHRVHENGLDHAQEQPPAEPAENYDAEIADALAAEKAEDK